MAGGMTYGSVRRVELVKEALVPRVDAVLQHPSHEVQHRVLAARPLGQLKREPLEQLLGRVLLHEHIPLLPLTSSNGGVPARLERRRLVGFPDEGDDERLDGVEELRRVSRCPNLGRPVLGGWGRACTCIFSLGGPVEDLVVHNPVRSPAHGRMKFTAKPVREKS